MYFSNSMYYDSAVLKELGLSEPKNYEDFKHCITVLKDAGKIPVALFGAEQWPAMAMYDLACVAEGAYEASNAVNDGKVKYGDDEAYFKAAKKLAELVEMGAFGTGALSTNASQAFELLTSGQAGFLVNGSWHWGTVEEEGNGDKVGWCHYNVFADADKAEETKTHCVGGTIKLNICPSAAIPPAAWTRKPWPGLAWNSAISAPAWAAKKATARWRSAIITSREAPVISTLIRPTQRLPRLRPCLRICPTASWWLRLEMPLK